MNLPLSFNTAVPKELREILAFYEKISGTPLADYFYKHFLDKIAQVQQNPRHFPFSVGDRRRVNLDRFPHHFLYRIKSNSIRILVLRHNRRNPRYGNSRI
jgi:plasmid stabilization system protein ParE